MIRRLSYLLLFLAPLLFVVVVNESARWQQRGTYSRRGVQAINPTKANPKSCTWACHDNTNHCKVHHVSLLKPHLGFTDQLYFGIINSMGATGRYGLVNLLVLGVLIPGLIYWFLVKSLQLQFKINALKQDRDARAD
ncbi:MAG: hypothetical protein AAF840_00575 [Bacteroidota bacterium]